RAAVVRTATSERTRGALRLGSCARARARLAVLMGRHYHRVLSRFTATSGPLIGSGRYEPSEVGLDGPESGGVAHRAPGRFLSATSTAWPAPALAAPLLVAWVAVSPRTPALAAVFSRASLFRQIG